MITNLYYIIRRNYNGTLASSKIRISIEKTPETPFISGYYGVISTTQRNAMGTIDSAVYQDELLPCSNKRNSSSKISYHCLVALNSSHLVHIEAQME